MPDVPLNEAMILWRPRNNPDAPPVMVVAIGENDERYFASSGACNADYQQDSYNGKMRRLLKLFVWITVKDGVSPKIAHDAFKVIPEYRELFEF